MDYVIYMQAGTGGMTQKGNPKGIGSLDDACGTVFSVGLGTVEEAAMRAKNDECTAAGMEGVEIMTYPDVAAGFRQVENQRADIMLSDLSLLTKYTLDNSDTTEMAFKILTGFKIGVAVVNDAGDLLRAIEDGLRIMEANGNQARSVRQVPDGPRPRVAHRGIARLSGDGAPGTGAPDTP